MSDALVDLGRHLFYDQRLSADGTMSCASCHEHARAFTDGRAVSVGVTGQAGGFNAPSLANVGYLPTLTWANPMVDSLEFHALIPLFGEDPVEMGNAGQEQALFARLMEDALYQDAFASAFPDRPQADLYTITRAAAGASDRRVYVELAQRGPGEVGNSYGRGMWAGVIELVGGDNIASGQIENWGPLNPEYVLSRQPEVILLAGSEWLNRPEAVLLGFGQDAALARERMAAYTTRPGWADLPAVQSGDVYGIYHGGNRTLSDFVYARAIAKAIHPESFADVDPAAELATFL